MKDRNTMPADSILPFVSREFLLEAFLERLKVELDGRDVSRFRRPSYTRAQHGRVSQLDGRQLFTSRDGRN